MKYGIVIDMHDEEKQDELTKALYEYLRYNTESLSESMDVTLMSELIFMPEGLIIIDVKDPVRCNAIELTWAVQRFLRGYDVCREDIVSIDLIDIRWVGSMIAGNDDPGNRKVEAPKDEAPKLEDKLRDLANEYYDKYFPIINNRDYTPLLDRVKEDCIDSDTFEPNEEYSIDFFYVHKNNETGIVVCVEVINNVCLVPGPDGYKRWTHIPVCIKVKAIHIAKDKYATRVLWGKDPLVY